MSKRFEIFVVLAGKIHGELARRIAEILAERDEVTDDELAKILEVDVNEVRRILNMLFESRLVKYRRARDEKIGWFKYYWRLTDEPPHLILEDRKRIAISLLKRRLQYEESVELYVCPQCGKKYTYEEADDAGYICIDCGEVLEPYDNTLDVEVLKEAIERLKGYKPLIVGKE